MDGDGLWHFAKSLPLCDMSDAVPDAGYQQSDDDKAAENDEAEKAQSHRLAPRTKVAFARSWAVVAG